MMVMMMAIKFFFAFPQHEARKLVKLLITAGIVMCEIECDKNLYNVVSNGFRKFRLGRLKCLIV